MKSKTTRTLTILIAVLDLVASAGGLFFDNLYRDNAFVTAVWRGNDVVTLLVAVPLLMIAFLLTKRGAKQALLIWLGLLDVILYAYAFYLFAAAFNWFFLIYVALFTSSIFALLHAGRFPRVRRGDSCLGNPFRGVSDRGCVFVWKYENNGSRLKSTWRLVVKKKKNLYFFYSFSS